MAADADGNNLYDITVKVKDDGIPSNRDAQATSWTTWWASPSTVEDM